MKKQVFLLLAALLAIVQNAFAYDFSAVAPSGQTLYYKLNGESVSVTYPGSTMSNPYSGYTAPIGDLIIPTSVTYIGTIFAVTSIGDDAFYGCSGLTSVTIPNSITSIGVDAFRNCTSLTSVTIPNSVTSIGLRAFYNCSGLTSVTIPNSVTSIGNYAFYMVLNVEYHGNATGSPWGARYMNCYIDGDFYYLDTTKHTLLGYLGAGGSITIPNSVTSISDYAFRDCTGLTFVTIPNSVTSIGGGAFYGCTGLSAISIPNSVTLIDNYTFYGCGGLTAVTIPSSITWIGSYVFADCTGLTSITIPNSVTTIGYNAFKGCSSLTSVSIPNTVTQIGSRAFENCINLTSLTLPDSITYIGNSTFKNCYNLTSITIPDSVIAIGDSAFYGCSSLNPVIIGKSVTSIGKSAFVCHFGQSLGGSDTIYFKPLMPPTITDLAFKGFGVFIMNGCAIDNYYIPYQYQSYSIFWYQYNYMLRDPIYDILINASPSDTTRGTAYVVPGRSNQDVRCDSTSVIQATTNYGYHFDHWSNGSIVNPDTLHLTGDSTIIAYFAPNRYTLTLISADTSLGTVIGGEYDYLDTVIITANAIEHYHFVRWSDGNTDNPRQIIIRGDSSLTAYFAIDTHMVSVQSNNIVRGRVDASGSEFVYGTPCTVTATPYSGYIFAGWSDGSRYNPYTFAVVSDTVLIARFLTEEEYEGIDDVIAIDVHIYQRDGKIVVEGAEGLEINVYDIDGRIVRNESLPNGVYMVKIGDLPARRVVVIR